MGFFLQRWRSLRTKPLHHVTLHSRDPQGCSSGSPGATPPGERRDAPAPSAPPPWRCPHGPAHGENLKKELVCGFALPGTAFPRVSPALSLPGERRDADILKAETGEGAFCPRPVCPTPTGVYPPRSRVWGGIEERASAWVRSPGYGFPRGIATTAPAPRGGGGGRRPGGVGDAGILKVETGEGAFCPLPVCPTPRGDVPTVQGMGRD
jgi:hypothetical protein